MCKIGLQYLFIFIFILVENYKELFKGLKASFVFFVKQHAVFIFLFYFYLFYFIIF